MKRTLEFLELLTLTILIPFTLFVICPFLLARLVGYLGGAW